MSVYISTSTTMGTCIFSIFFLKKSDYLTSHSDEEIVSCSGKLESTRPRINLRIKTASKCILSA